MKKNVFCFFLFIFRFVCRSICQSISASVFLLILFYTKKPEMSIPENHSFSYTATAKSAVADRAVSAAARACPSFDVL